MRMTRLERIRCIKGGICPDCGGEESLEHLKEHEMCKDCRHILKENMKADGYGNEAKYV